MAREPEAACTLVATRRKSPEGVFWKIVTVAPVIALIWSTTGVVMATSLFLPSHSSPIRTRGSDSGVTSPESWFLASHGTGADRGLRSMLNPPACARTYWATARSESTLAAVEAPWVDTTPYTPEA